MREKFNTLNWQENILHIENTYSYLEQELGKVITNLFYTGITMEIYD